MTARARQVPLIFRDDEVPEARRSDALRLARSGANSEEAELKSAEVPGAELADQPSSPQAGEPEPHRPIKRVNSVNPTKPRDASTVRDRSRASLATSAGSTARSAGADSGAIVPGSSPLPANEPMSYREVRESLERVQLGPRVHPSYKAFLEDLFHPIRHQSDGGMQTMLMACLEIVKRDPDLQRRAQAWASESDEQGSD